MKPEPLGHKATDELKVRLWRKFAKMAGADREEDWQEGAGEEAAVDEEASSVDNKIERSARSVFWGRAQRTDLGGTR